MNITPIGFNKISMPPLIKHSQSNSIKHIGRDTVSFGHQIRKFSGDVKERTLQGTLMDFKKYDTTRNVFKYFGIKTTVLEKNGTLVLSSYEQPSDDFTFSDLEIDENSLIRRVVGIEGNADFRRSKINSTRHITRIGGNCNITKSPIKRIPALEYVGGNFDAEFTSLESLGALRIVCGNANLSFSQLKNLGSLKYVDGDLDLTGNYSLDSLDNVKRVGGDLYIADTNIVNAGKLQDVGGSLYLRQDQLDILIDELPTEVLSKCVVVQNENEE